MKKLPALLAVILMLFSMVAAGCDITIKSENFVQVGRTYDAVKEYSRCV